MDLEARKYQFIKEVSSLDDLRIIDALERVLKREKEACKQIPEKITEELDNRLENYQNNREDLLNWEDVKDDW